MVFLRREINDQVDLDPEWCYIRISFEQGKAKKEFKQPEVVFNSPKEALDGKGISVKSAKDLTLSSDVQHPSEAHAPSNVQVSSEALSITSRLNDKHSRQGIHDFPKDDQDITLNHQKAQQVSQKRMTPSVNVETSIKNDAQTPLNLDVDVHTVKDGYGKQVFQELLECPVSSTGTNLQHEKVSNLQNDIQAPIASGLKIKTAKAQIQEQKLRDATAAGFGTAEDAFGPEEPPNISSGNESVGDIGISPIDDAAQWNIVENVCEFLPKIETQTDAEEVEDRAQAAVKLMEVISDHTGQERAETPPGFAGGLKLYDHQKIALHWMKDRETSAQKGGILADDMGLGKTVEIIALLLAHPSEKPKLTRRNESKQVERQNNGVTLVVAPANLLTQWQKEIQTKTQPRLSCVVLSGIPKKLNSKHLCSENIVLVSYETLRNDFSNKNKGKHSIFFDSDYMFHRIVLDEAHKIKNRNTGVSEACYNLLATYRWYVSGTPIQNKLEELYPAMRFLRVEGLEQWDDFERQILSTLNTTVSMGKIFRVFEKYLLRRKKTDTIDGKGITNLPEKIETIEYAYLNAHQSDYYQAFEAETKSRYETYDRSTNHSIDFKKALLLRLRQCALHPWLINFSKGDDLHKRLLTEKILVENAIYGFKKSQIHYILDILSKGKFNCQQCKSKEVARIISGCGHALCSDCFSDISEDEDLGWENIEPGVCTICTQPYDPLKITTLIAFQTAYKEGFRKDPWDEEVAMDEEDPFRNDEATLEAAFKPLRVRMSKSGGRFGTEPRQNLEHFDEEIWGADRIESLRSTWADHPTDMDTSFIDDDAVNWDEPDINEEYLLDIEEDKKRGREVAELDIPGFGDDDDDDDVEEISRPTKRICTLADLDARKDVYMANEFIEDIMEDVMSIQPSKENMDTAVTATGQLTPPLTEAGSDTIITEDDFLFDGIKTSSTFECQLQDDEASELFEDSAKEDENEGEEENSLDAGTDTILAPRAAPRLQLKIKINPKTQHHEFILPYNLKRLQAQARQNSGKWSRRYIQRLINDNLPACAKITLLQSILLKKQNDNPNDRIIIFSEFLTLLDFVEASFNVAGKDDFLRYDGSLSQAKKTATVKDFMDLSNNKRILLCSLRAGNVGLNLTSANHVILMDPCYNPYIEDQAVDRCHRIGQTKQVYVTRLVVPGTIESRIMTLQAEKRALVDCVVDGKGDRGLGQLTKEDTEYLLGFKRTTLTSRKPDSKKAKAAKALPSAGGQVARGTSKKSDAAESKKAGDGKVSGSSQSARALSK